MEKKNLLQFFLFIISFLIVQSVDVHVTSEVWHLLLTIYSKSFVYEDFYTRFFTRYDFHASISKKKKKNLRGKSAYKKKFCTTPVYKRSFQKCHPAYINEGPTVSAEVLHFIQTAFYCFKL